MNFEGNHKRLLFLCLLLILEVVHLVQSINSAPILLADVFSTFNVFFLHLQEAAIEKIVAYFASFLKEKIVQVHDFARNNQVG